MSTGYIKLFRSLKQSSFYLDSQYVHLWVHLLMSVNRSEKRLKIGKTDTFIDLMPGQVLTSRDKLVLQTGINRSKIERILKSFENEHQIEQQTFSKYRVISITKWQDYQVGEHENEQEMSNKRAASEQQVSTNKKEENKEKENKEPRGVFHPPGLEEVTAYCSERNRGVNPQKWHDFYTSKNWMAGKNKMKDWRAAVRTWEKDEAPQITSKAAKSREDEIAYLKREGLI